MDIVSRQPECDAAFRHWADVLIGNARLTTHGWIIEGKGVLFTNYGHGEHGEIDNQVMLGVDPDTGNSTVKIVNPKAARRDKGPATVLAIDEKGRRFLLREGRLTVNKVSDFIIDEFGELTGLPEVPLMVGGVKSDRHWYVVANLDAAADEIVAQTADFSNACSRARTLAGAGKEVNDQETDEPSRPTYGMDEKGRITKHKRAVGTVEVCELQGFVFEALKKIVGPELKKPKANGYCVDGMIGPANLLIEIKTGTSAQCIYEAVGQLQLYPNLIGLEGMLERILLIPDQRPLKPVMAAALGAANISIFTYSINDSGKKPTIGFPDALIERCRRSAPC